MPITDTQQSDRTKFLGSSDVPSLFMGGRYDLWLKKTGRSTPDKAGKAAEIGKRLEDGLIEWARDELQLSKLTKNAERRWNGTRIKVHVDAVAAVTAEKAGVTGTIRLKPTGQIVQWAATDLVEVCVEAKTHGIMNPWNIDEQWGEPGTDEVPDYVLFQGQTHMGATGSPRCYVPVLIPGKGLNMFVVDRDEEIIAAIKKEAEDFWVNHVQADKAPGDPGDDEIIGRTLTTLRSRKRDVARLAIKATKQEEVVVKQWDAAKQGVSMMSELRDRKEAAVLAILGAAECLILSDGSAVTYFKSSRKGYVVKPTSYHSLKHPPKTPGNLTMVMARDTDQGDDS